MAVGKIISIFDISIEIVLSDTNIKVGDILQVQGDSKYRFEVVEISNKEEQTEKEKYWIKFYSTDTYGYNSNKGG